VEILNFGHWDLFVICDLSFVICDLKNYILEWNVLLYQSQFWKLYLVHNTRFHHQRREKMWRLYLIAALVLTLVLLCAGFSFAQQPKKVGGRIIVCMIQLEHADAEYIATVLKPFLSPEGSIVPYKTTNTLIIKDREPVVNMLAEIIKGKPCTPISEQGIGVGPR
jgi:type II secretory pathway component GspD/PulD (secretin)